MRQDFLSQLEIDQIAVSQAMHRVELVDGSFLQVLDVGQGDPIILVPMIKELNFFYVPQIEEFKTDHRVVLYEPRVSRHVRLHVIDRAREAVQLMDSLGLENAHIVAWSDAGAAAYHLAKYWPERCRSVVLIGLPDRYRLPQPIDFLMKVLWRLPIEPMVSTFLLSHILALFMKGPLVKHSWIVKYAATIPQLPRLFKHSCLPNMMEHKPTANEVATPCLVICGDRDPVISPEQARKMSALFSGAAETIIVPNGEHCSVYVNDIDVNRALRGFYSKLPFNIRNRTSILSLS